MPSAIVAPPTDDRLAGQALRHGGIGLDLDAVDRDARLHRPGRSGAAGEQAAAADRDDQRIEVRRILQHLQRQRALAGDHAEVVVGMDEDQLPLRRQRLGMRGGLGQGLAVQHDMRAPGRGARHLGRRREFRHHDGGGDAGQAGMPRHRLGVVAGRHRDDAALALALGQQRQAVGRAALLEGAGDLQIVELQHHLGAGGARNRVAGQRGRAQHAAGDPLGRRRHIGKASARQTNLMPRIS